jgi:hypothetical protein
MKDRQPKRKARGSTGKKYDPPLSLFPLTFNQALDKLLAARSPEKTPKRKA